MGSEHTPEAWVAIPTNEQLAAFRQAAAASGARHPYDFGFMPAMGRLIIAHPRIGGALSALFNEVMFAPGHLDRREREMIAAVSAAAQDCHY
jgi:alkylhydroperoxidase/carboxymuconolactone decarboxylase family protein YurZ